MNILDFLFPEISQSIRIRDLSQQSRLNQHRAKLDQARNAASRYSSSKKIKQLQEEVDQLTIIVEALLEKLDESGNLPRSELIEKISEIDARDGVIDGKITKKKSPTTPTKVKRPKTI
ncbi:MAG: hypothetical protein AAF226_17195 [Verrucomicrobiota bacterium]